MPINNINFKDVEPAEKYAPSTKGRSNTSITIVKTDKFGKRIAISSGLVKAMSITDFVYIGVIVDKRQIILSGSKTTNLKEYKLSKGNIIYNARLVDGIIAAIGLEKYYENHSSKSFSDIEIDEESGVAVVTIPTVEETNEEGEDE